MVDSFSQVASLDLKFLHCTFKLTMVCFLSYTSLLSSIWRGSCTKSPFGSTYNKDQSITCLVSYTYLFNKDVWKTLWTLMWAGKASSYATGPLLDVQYLKESTKSWCQLFAPPQAQWDSIFFYFYVNLVTDLIIFIFYFLICVTLLEVMHFFKVLLDLSDQLFLILQ